MERSACSCTPASLLQLPQGSSKRDIGLALKAESLCVRQRDAVLLDGELYGSVRSWENGSFWELTKEKDHMVRRAVPLVTPGTRPKQPRAYRVAAYLGWRAKRPTWHLARFALSWYSGMSFGLGCGHAAVVPRGAPPSLRLHTAGSGHRTLHGSTPFC